jgi:hypothetical protein
MWPYGLLPAKLGSNGRPFIALGISAACVIFATSVLAHLLSSIYRHFFEEVKDPPRR